MHHSTVQLALPDTLLFIEIVIRLENFTTRDTITPPRMCGHIVGGRQKSVEPQVRSFSNFPLPFCSAFLFTVCKLHGVFRILHVLKGRPNGRHETHTLRNGLPPNASWRAETKRESMSHSLVSRM